MSQSDPKTDDNLADYFALRAQGWSHNEAIGEMMDYLHYVSLGKLKERLMEKVALGEIELD